MIQHIFIIGAPKTGTVSLFFYIFKHNKITNNIYPEINFNNKIKHNTQFFSCNYDDTLSYSDNYQNFLKFFIDNHFKKEQNINLNMLLDNSDNFYVCDSTPTYLLCGSYVIPKIYNSCPYINSKFICILRNPIQRAFSHYLICQKLCKPSNNSYKNISFIDVINREIELINYHNIHHEVENYNKIIDKMNKCFCNCCNNILMYGCYNIQLLQWIDTFNENLLILLTEDLEKKNIDNTMNNIFNFFNLPIFEDQNYFSNNYTLENEIYNDNIKFKNQITENEISILKNFYKPYNDKLYQLIKRPEINQWNTI